MFLFQWSTTEPLRLSRRLGLCSIRTSFATAFPSVCRVLAYTMKHLSVCQVSYHFHATPHSKTRYAVVRDSPFIRLLRLLQSVILFRRITQSLSGFLYFLPHFARLGQQKRTPTTRVKVACGVVCSASDSFSRRVTLVVAETVSFILLYSIFVLPAYKKCH